MSTNNQQKEIRLRAEFHNGQVYVYYGKTKKECLSKLKAKFGNTKGFVLEFTKEAD